MTLNARQKLIHTFSIDYVSDIDERRYSGRFSIKKMSIRDLAALGVRKSQLNGGMYFNDDKPGHGVDEGTDNFNNMIAHLEICVKEAPDWWNLDEITDVSLISKVFQEVIAFENSFLTRQADRALAGRDGEGSSKTGLSEADNAGGPSAVVADEIQAALEP